MQPLIIGLGFDVGNVVGNAPVCRMYTADVTGNMIATSMQLYLMCYVHAYASMPSLQLPGNSWKKVAVCNYNLKPGHMPTHITSMQKKIYDGMISPCMMPPTSVAPS